MQVTCPPNAGPGSAVMIQVPGAPTAVAQPMQQLAPQPMMMATGSPPVVMGSAVSAAMGAQALSVGPQDQVPLLDPVTAGILATVNSFQVRQRVRFWETLSGGCCEQENVYDVFDTATGTHVFIVQEESDDCMRCCCAPYHSFRAHFKLVNNGERQWSSRGDIYNMPTVMTVDREGCMDKPCLSCCAFSDGCKDGMALHAGIPTSPPGYMAIGDSTIAYAGQPKCGGYFTPTLNLFSRQSPGADKEGSFIPLAKVEGPCIFGGCSELCCSSEFKISSMKPESLDAAIGVGDLASIIKERPKGPCACGRELFTDSDHFTVNFKEGVGLTPQQKASFMASMVLLDYMFFEQDHGMITFEDKKIKITLFEYYCLGAVVPCVIHLDTSNNGGGGGGPETQQITR